jgi:hypothetical protein
MTSKSDEVPVHQSLKIIDREDIYKKSEWWKSVVRYKYDSSKNSEIAVYLWHNDGNEWNRKNKYVIKSMSAWNDDSKVIERLFDAESTEKSVEDFPVSDYYTLATGETIFQTDNWWKAILNIDMKGEYETDEVMVYLWQQRNGKWKRRQKSTIKSVNDWETLKQIVENLLINENDGVVYTEDTTIETSTKSDSDRPDPVDGEVVEELSELETIVEDHLSETMS